MITCEILCILAYHHRIGRLLLFFLLLILLLAILSYDYYWWALFSIILPHVIGVKNNFHQTLGNLGGLFPVLLSFVFLSVQTRHNTSLKADKPITNIVAWLKQYRQIREWFFFYRAWHTVQCPLSYIEL